MKALEFTAEAIAQILDGQVEGDKAVLLSNFGKIETAQAGDLTFLSNPKYEQFLYTTKASAVLVKADYICKEPISTTLIRVEDPYAGLASLLRLVDQQMNPKREGIDSQAIIDPSAKIGEKCYIASHVTIEADVIIEDGVQIYPNTFIGRGSHIGANSLIYSNVSIYYATEIGRNCVVHSGAVIGADGFGFAPTFSGYEKIPQIGSVILEDNVEIGANTCVDRAAIGHTIIRQGTKLDNLVQIAHNCDIGANNVLAGQVGIAGSSKTGAWCQLGGQVGIAGHLTLGERVKLSAKTGVISDVASDSVLFGVPATDTRQAMRQVALIRRLGSLFDEVKALKKELELIQKEQS